jgi:hypothetical protein
MNACPLSLRPCRMLEMKISQSFFNGQDEPDRIPGQLHGKLIHSQIQEFSKRCARLAFVA